MEKDESLYGDRKRDEEKVDISSVDSPINTATAETDPHRSLTNDEDAETDPNSVSKPSFDRGNNDRGRFDGEIGI